MAVSKKIEKEVEKLEKKEEAFKKLMMEILEMEAKGNYNYKAKYDELVKKYIEENAVGVVNNDQNWKNRIVLILFSSWNNNILKWGIIMADIINDAILVENLINPSPSKLIKWFITTWKTFKYNI